MSVAPADAKVRLKWPLWRSTLAYVVLAVLAGFSIWFVDRDAMQQGAAEPAVMTNGQ